MNILIPDSWLRTLLETKEPPNSIAEKLSLTGFSVEKVDKVGNDFVYDIEVTTNRADGLSVLGIAREIYANFKFNNITAKLNQPKGIGIEPKLEVKELPLKVKIEKPALCPRFSAIILDNLTVKPSPTTIQKHLELVGVRALNNIVDISNYIMFELGQPMHAFDYDKIINSNMFLREAVEGEQITTLDGKKRKLPAGTIVIEDNNRLIDLCGIMGAANSQISQNTKRVLLFVQTYDPVRIRKASQKLNLRTEASSRFEKGLDTVGVMPALNRAVYLAKELSGAKVASKVIDIYYQPYKTKSVSLSQQKLTQYMASEFPLAKAKSILENLGFAVQIEKDKLAVKVPSFRAADIDIEEDLIEEVARISGFDNIPNLLPTGEIQPQFNSVFYWEDRVKNYFKYQGFYEIYTYSMISKSDLENVRVEPLHGLLEQENLNLPSGNLNSLNALRIKNPLNSDLEYMRPTLLPSLLKVIGQNQGREEDLKFFELAARYEPTSKSKLPKEIPTLAGIVQSNNFYQVKGIIEGLFEDLGITPTFTQAKIPNLVAQLTAKITANGQELGRIGKVEPKVAKSFGVEGNVYTFCLLFETLANLAKLTKKYTPISKYPEVVEDISMIVNKRQEVGKILEVINQAGGVLLVRTEVFDIFENPKLGKNKKSVAVHLTYQSQTHNLSSREVETIRKKIISTLETEIGAKVRLKEVNPDVST